MSILAVVGSRRVSRTEVLEWEDRRVNAAAKKLGLTIPPGDLAQRRDALLRAKLDLGPDRIAALLVRDLRWAGRIARTSNVGSRRKLSVCELHVASGSAARFAEWFRDRTS